MPPSIFIRVNVIKYPYWPLGRFKVVTRALMRLQNLSSAPSLISLLKYYRFSFLHGKVGEFFSFYSSVDTVQDMRKFYLSSKECRYWISYTRPTGLILFFFKAIVLFQITRKKIYFQTFVLKISTFFFTLNNNGQKLCTWRFYWFFTFFENYEMLVILYQF